MRLLITSLFIVNVFLSLAQPKPKPTVLSGDQFANVVEQSLDLFYAEYAQKQNSTYEAVIASFNYADGQVVEFSDDVYCQRLKEINKLTPFKLECNEKTETFRKAYD